MLNKATPPSPLRAVFEPIFPVLKRAMFFGFFINLLSLVPTAYMLEVYDRVVNSRNSTTLLMLTVLMLVMALLHQMLEWVRGQVLHGAGQHLEAELGERVFNAVFGANLRRVSGASQPLNDLRTLREFISTPAVTALMDAPMALLFLVLIFAISPLLGWFSVMGAVVQVYIAYLTERSTHKPLKEASQASVSALSHAASALRNAQVIESMGMLDAIHERWIKKQRRFLFMQALGSAHAGSTAAAAKFVQNVIASALLGLGAWLLLKGELAGGGGMMIVGSILGGKVLAPLVQVIGTWKTIVGARDAYQRLDKLLQATPDDKPGMALPAPKGTLSVEGVMAGAPGSPVAILRGVSFVLPAGQALAILGPSASGKSTLARLMMGIWPAINGKVRLDGVDIHSWRKEELGPHIGYLPQGIELFDGTLAENIARFGELDMAKVEAAARAVGLHETILALPAGYDSRIGDDGCFLSGGQRQRVGLARAIYGEPSFIVLDEPNSSLDDAGEQALIRTLLALKARGATLIVITHRPSLLAVADHMLILRDGTVQIGGPRDEVLAALARAKQPQPQAASSQPQVGVA